MNNFDVFRKNIIPYVIGDSFILGNQAYFIFFISTQCPIIFHTSFMHTKRYQVQV